MFMSLNASLVAGAAASVAVGSAVACNANLNPTHGTYPLPAGFDPEPQHDLFNTTGEDAAVVFNTPLSGDDDRIATFERAGKDSVTLQVSEINQLSGSLRVWTGSRRKRE